MLLEPTSLRIDLLTDSKAALLRLTGSLDSDSASALVADAERLVLRGHRHLILDCGAVTFCDSFGLRAMLVLRDRVRPDGSVTIGRPSDTLMRLLEISGEAESFDIVNGSS
jgi:anti-sigma B factor antagonist